MRRAAIVIAALLVLPACVGRLGQSSQLGADDRAHGMPASSVERCRELDDDRSLWAALAKGGAIVAGGSGLAAVPVDDQGARLGLALGAVAAAAFAALASELQEGRGDEWARECTSPPSVVASSAPNQPSKRKPRAVPSASVSAAPSAPVPSAAPSESSSARGF